MLSFVSAVAGRLRWVIADLLQPHEVCQDDSPPLNAVRLFKCLCQFADRLFVQCRLAFAQSTESVDFCFFW